MALDRNNARTDRMLDLDDRDTGRSSFASFLIGGVVVAGGLFAFLFYDGGAVTGGRDISVSDPYPSITQSAPTLNQPAR